MNSIKNEQKNLIRQSLKNATELKLVFRASMYKYKAS